MPSTNNTPTLPAMLTPFAESHIGKLPTELLENIFLELVKDVQTVFERPHPHSSRLTILRDLQTPPTDLAFRTVCIAFRNSSWRALAKKIEYTIFDLISKNSIENLEAIAQSPELAPWVTQLHITCQTTFMYYPFQEDPEISYDDQVAMLPVSAREEMLQIKKIELDWHPNTWSLWSKQVEFYGNDDYDVHSLNPQKARSHEFEEVLAKVLTCFKNVDRLCYLHEPAAIPGRYHDLVKNEEKFREAIPMSFGGLRSDLNAHLGLDVTLTACALSELRPRVLELAVDLDEHHAFITSLPKEVLSAVSGRVEDLKLFEKFCPFYDPYNAQTQMPRVVITKDTFPTLQSLTIDHMGDIPDPYVSVVPLPSLSNVPKITHLAVKGTRQTGATLLSFVERYGKDLESVSLHGVAEDSYDPMLNVLRQFSLKKLKIAHMTEHYWRTVDDQSANVLLEALQRDRIKDVADEIVLEPQHLVMALEKFKVHGGRGGSNSDEESDLEAGSSSGSEEEADT